MTAKLVLINASNWPNEDFDLVLPDRQTGQLRDHKLAPGESIVLTNGEEITVSAELSVNPGVEGGYNEVSVTVGKAV